MDQIKKNGKIYNSCWDFYIGINTDDDHIMGEIPQVKSVKLIKWVFE